MSVAPKLEDKRFWETLSYLMNLQTKTEIVNVLNDLAISEKELYSFISFLDSVHFHLTKDNGHLVPPQEKPLINVEFSLLEWLKFQAHFPLMEKNASRLPFHPELKNKLTQLEVQYAKYDLYAPLELMNKIQLGQQQAKTTLKDLEGQSITTLSQTDEQFDEKDMVLLEQAITDSKVLEVEFKNNKIIEIYPHKIVHLDGHISLISEDRIDKSIVHFHLKDIQRVKMVESTYHATFSKLEIDDFISSLRAISETEIRLILKIYSKDKAHEKPLFQHLGNPCLITNPQGDTIWAASVEPCKALMDWLFEMGNQVEILDPVSFQNDYLKYCADRLKNVA